MTRSHSERLYYDDSYLTHFTARVVERTTCQESPAVVLDRTAFYPTSGGQPNDRGTLNDVAVVDVQVRESDGALLHLLAADLPAEQVAGQIDWARRLDHMQQHSGQHLLSAVCEQLLNADTVSFHLGAETCTIDLNVARMPFEALERAENHVNQVIWENRPMTARRVERSELAGLALRRPPPVDGPLRLIEVAGLDLNPCGGTHVSHTGEIGLLKVLRLEYRGSETRVEFLCGGRALHDYRQKNHILLQLSAALTVGYWELEESIVRLQEELKATRHDLRLAQEQLLVGEAAQLRQAALPYGSARLAQAIYAGRSPTELRALAQRLSAHSGVLAVLASLEERVHLCVARADDVSVDAVGLLRAVLEPLEGKGGGQPPFAQGSAPPAAREAVQAAITAALAAHQ